MFLKSKWKEIIALLSLIAAVLHPIITFFFATNLSNFLGILPQDVLPILLLIIGGIPLALQIILKAVKGDLGADLLALIALIVATYLKQYLAADLVVLMLCSGQVLEDYATNKASFALQALVQRMPAIAHLKVRNQVVDVEISTIAIGDVIEIYPHETCPVDGTVVEGNGTMDESYLTGEPYYIAKAPGSVVLSGAINGENLITIRADKLPQDSRYATVVKVMQNAEMNRPKMRRLADQLGAIFAPLALIVAFVAFFFTKNAMIFLAVLVVATPCPLLIAVPISVISAISIAAKHGIIIRNPIILEKLPICSTAIFDKTGTLTRGKPELVEIVVLNGFEKNAVLQMVASLERYSRHPLALAIIVAAQEANLELIEVENISEKSGQGLVGNVGGKKVAITHRKKLSQQNVDLPPSQRGLECVIMIDDQIAALFQFFDMPHPNGHFFVNHLGPSHNFNKVMLVSGDRQSEVEHLAKMLEIEEVYYSQTPEQKLEIVRKENAKAPTLFIGDGINDAPALTAATAGIAFGQHNGVTSEAAAAVILDNSLVKVDQLIHISESMRSIALQSAVGGMLLSLIGMIFAVCGKLDPVYGALLQEVIDVAAILNALRLVWKPVITADVK